MAGHQKDDILPTIQIQIYIKERLAQYYDKVKKSYRDLLETLEIDINIYEDCPICHKRGCARFIDYYHRQVVDERNVLFKEFPIARYLCITKKKSFSLLPYQLVPYSKYSIPFIIKALELRQIEGLSLSKLQDYIAGFGQNEILSISHGELIWFKRLLIRAVEKIKATRYYSEFDEQTKNKATQQDLLINFIEFAKAFECLKHNPPIRGPCGLGHDFYLNGGGYLRGAYFLFGTPSQFRVKR